MTEAPRYVMIGSLFMSLIGSWFEVNLNAGSYVAGSVPTVSCNPVTAKKSAGYKSLIYKTLLQGGENVVNG